MKKHVTVLLTPKIGVSENGESYEERVAENNQETQDLFPVAMDNLFTAGKVLIEAILDGKLRP